jgi:Pilus formation protein N terminal region
MHSKRILSIQRRAKRRLVFMAIVGTAFVGYSALSLFAQESGSSQTSASKINTVPGVKAVGIRLINSNAKPQNTALSSSTNASAPTLLLPPPQMLPPAFDLPQLDKTVASLPMPSTIDAESKLPAAGFSSLPVPPRMTDVLPSSKNGKVVVKISGSDEIKAPVEVPSLPTSTLPTPTPIAETVDIRVIQPILLGEPTALPPMVVEKSPKRVEAVTAIEPPFPISSGIRVSLGDSGFKQNSLPISSENSKAASPKPRTPQLVKTKATQISHTVVIAHSADLESTEPSVPEEMDRPVEVETSLVPNSIAKAAFEKDKDAGEPEKSGAARVSIKDAVADPLFEVTPPPAKMVESVVDRNKDDKRRKFDARPASQSVAAVIELESLAATNIDLMGKLTGLAVQDESVCKVIQSDRMVSLVGNQVGSTLVQIWSADLGDKPQMIRVNVTQKKGQIPTGRDDVRNIKQVIAQNFPRADVNIIGLNDGGIEVRGATESEESAKRILELIRKVYLVPVKDKLIVSR